MVFNGECKSGKTAFSETISQLLIVSQNIETYTNNHRVIMKIISITFLLASLVASVSAQNQDGTHLDVSRSRRSAFSFATFVMAKLLTCSITISPTLNGMLRILTDKWHAVLL